MVGSSLKKDNLSTPRRPATCVAIFFICWSRFAFARWIVKASLPEVNQFTGNCFRVVRIVLKITFLGLRYPGQRPECPSLSYYGSCRQFSLRHRWNFSLIAKNLRSLLQNTQIYWGLFVPCALWLRTFYKGLHRLFWLTHINPQTFVSGLV